MRAFEAAKNPYLWTPCHVCEEFLLDKEAKIVLGPSFKGKPGPPIKRTEPPPCHKCVKFVEQEALGDPKVMEVVFLYRLGIRDTDDIIRSDSWRYAAHRILQGFEAAREQAEWKNRLAKGKG